MGLPDCQIPPSFRAGGIFFASWLTTAFACLPEPKGHQRWQISFGARQGATHHTRLPFLARWHLIRDMTVTRATSVAHSHSAVDHVALNYDERLLRRKRLTTAAGEDVLVDLAETLSLGEGDCLILEDGRAVAVRAADEPLLEITGDLARLAWHIGNRHTPCQIFSDRLRIRDDHVLKAMLEQLGAEISEVSGPFTPEGGAYGHGRTFGHSHD